MESRKRVLDDGPNYTHHVVLGAKKQQPRRIHTEAHIRTVQLMMNALRQLKEDASIVEDETPIVLLYRQSPYW